jgi:integrase
MPARYIQKRRQRWYAVLDIPSDLRASFNGRPRFVESMKTGNEAKAVLRAAPKIALWKLQIAKAKASLRKLKAKEQDGGDDLEEATYWRTQVDAWENEEDDMSDVITDRAEQIEKARGYPAAKLFADVAFGKATLLEPLAEEWLAESNYGVRATYDHRLRLSILYKHHKVLESINRKVAGEFVTKVLAKDGKSPQTVRRYVTTLSSLWRWLERRGHVEANPWTNQGLIRSNNGEDQEEDVRRPFTEEEASRWLRSLDGAARDVSMVMAVTGMRFSEVVGLVQGNVKLDGKVVWLTIQKGKTKAAKRRVPVVAGPVVALLKARLTAASAAGQASLFPELPADKLGAKGNALRQSMVRKLRALGMKDTSLVANHSWRHRARTLMEQADVAPWVADFVIGHARPGQGLGRYSQGPSDAQLIAAVKAVPLPVAGPPSRPPRNTKN